MAHKLTIDAYDKIAKEFAHRDIWQKEYEIYFDLLAKGSDVIEIGCGTQGAAKTLLKKYKYTGIDASHGMLSIAKRKVPQGKFLLMDFYELNFPEDTFDGFWAAASLLHVPKAEINYPLREIYRVVRKGGIGFISLKEKKEFDEGIVKQKITGVERYFSYYATEEFVKILVKNNFEVLKVTEVLENNPDKTNWLCYFVKSGGYD